MRDGTKLSGWQTDFCATYVAALAVDGTIYDTIGIWPLVVAGFAWLGCRVYNWSART